MLRSRWGLVALALAFAALAFAAALLAPQRYLGRGAVLLPEGMLKAEYSAADPQTAAALVQAFIDRQENPLLVDLPLVVPVERDVAEHLVLSAAIFLLILLLLWRRKPAAARSERDLVAALGVPLIAVRPLAPQELARQLLAHWFGRGHPVLAVVSAEAGAGRTRVAVELARAFAAAGEPTLLVDANFRSPEIHRALGLRNRAGLADFLCGRKTRIAHCGENLSVLVAGRTAEDPLELLSLPRMRELLAAAAKRYRVVLVDTPDAAHGPDLQLFAAFAGGALVVTRRESDADGLKALDRHLRQASACVVGAVIGPAVAS